MRAVAAWLLYQAERLFLHAHGWERDYERELASNARKAGRRYDYYLPPADYEFRAKDASGYNHWHAVNAQRQRKS